MTDSSSKKEIWTIGHSIRPLEEFIDILKSFEIELLVDVRRYPGSRKFPFYNKENLEISLPENGINYLHLENLGGRRKMRKDSENTAWRLASFRGYADYMETTEFATAAEELESVADKNKVAYMCSEAVWWSCHRSLISDYLKVRDWTVHHIMNRDKIMEHPYTKPAKVENGKLSYKSS